MKLEAMGSGIDLWEQSLGVGQFIWQADHSPVLSCVASTQAAEIGHRVGLWIFAHRLNSDGRVEMLAAVIHHQVLAGGHRTCSSG